MDDKEFVEVWRAQYQEWAMRCSKDIDLEYGWMIWLAAKRSQQSVVLPKPEVCFVDKPFAYVQDEIHATLTAAGIKYTIG